MKQNAGDQPDLDLDLIECHADELRGALDLADIVQAFDQLAGEPASGAVLE